MYDIVINAVSENEFCPYYPRKCKILCPIGNYPLLYFIIKYEPIYNFYHYISSIENYLYF